ncbi:MAG: ATP-binding cassette domain-containing protein, partial [Planctomycetaceae bacterium]
MKCGAGTDDPLFELSDVSVNFGDTEALKKVTVSIPRGGIVAICGRSASGKSTLLNVLGLLRVGRHEGKVTYHPPEGHGHTVTFDKIDAEEATRCRSQQFGFILQSSYLLPFLKAAENAQLPLLIRNTTGEARQTAFSRITTQLNGVAESTDSRDDLKQAAQNLPDSISGGQKQRFGILRALIHDPLVVFADEPCA